MKESKTKTVKSFEMDDFYYNKLKAEAEALVKAGYRRPDYTVEDLIRSLAEEHAKWRLS